MRIRVLLMIAAFAVTGLAQMPPIEPGVSLELAKWRAARYSDVRYKLNLTLEKMSPVLNGTIEIRVNLSAGAASIMSEPPASAGGQSVAPEIPPIILDWRRIKGHEEKSTISNITVNGRAVTLEPNWPPADAGGSDFSEHLIFRDGVVIGENVIKLDFTSPILTSGSAITRYVDKEDGSEYIYSLFVPSDASTAFPVFDQPDLKARFSLTVGPPLGWTVVSNNGFGIEGFARDYHEFAETKPLSTYVFAFAAGPFEKFTDTGTVGGNPSGSEGAQGRTESTLRTLPTGRVSASVPDGSIYVRRSQAAKFKPHAAEVFRLNREAVKYFEEYFDYKFPFPKYDLVLIPEFPFGGMEHAGATFLRESSIIFPQEPTKNDYISRASLIFHEASHQWFGDTVTMRWFDDLWLKEGFATFTAYKAMEKIMPEYNAWKVFYERVKQAAYQTDSTKGTTPIYQEIKNLSAAKSAYGAIVYNKAPAFLRQAEFYLGEDKFQTAVRAFLKKHEFGNAGWEDLVKEFGTASRTDLNAWASRWVKSPGLPIVRPALGYWHADGVMEGGKKWWQTTRNYRPEQQSNLGLGIELDVRLKYLLISGDSSRETVDYNLADKSSYVFSSSISGPTQASDKLPPVAVIPNYQDYGYGIFLLDPKSCDYVLKNIGSEKDDFLRTMMWGALWDSVREGEMDPRQYVDLVIRNINLETDESTIQTLLSRVSTAMRYYIDGGASTGSVPPASAGGKNAATKSTDSLATKRTTMAKSTPPTNAGGTDLTARLETLLIDRMQNAPTPGQKITYYRAFLSLGSSPNARRIMKEILNKSMRDAVPKPAREQGRNLQRSSTALTNGRASAITTKDRFDIVQRLIILGDPEAAKLLADLERTETSDDAKRYAYAAKAGFATAENKAKFWNDFVNKNDISESWIEAAFGPFNNIRHAEVTLPYLERALKELPNHKRNRKIFFVNGWLGAFIGGQRSEEALAIINKFLADNPDLDRDLRLKILENSDIIERAVKIRKKYGS